ncbi:MAG TPA: LuxR C-terminal-related transcriptional regulator [Ktedonobacteraceae bacterium]
MSDLLQEMGNLRAVMRFAIEHHEQEMALRLGGALGPLWMLLGTSNQRVYLIEGTQFLWQALEGSKGLATGSRARALILYGGLFSWIGEPDRSERTSREGLALFQQLGDLQGTIHGHWMLFLALFARCDLHAAHQIAQKAVTLSRQHGEACTWWDATWTLGYSLFNVGMVAVYDGRAAEGRAALEEGIRLCTSVGDRFFSTWSALYLGEIIALEGKKDEAHNLLEQSLNASRALEMKTQESDALRFLGLLALRSGEIDRAETLLTESTRISKEADDTQCIIWGLIWLARVKVARQQIQEAQALLTEGVELAMSRSDILTLPACLEGWSFIRATQDKPLWVVRLFACAHALRETMGEPVPPIDRLEYDNLLASVRAQLDQATFQAAWAQGLNLSAEQALTEPEEMEKAATTPKEPDHTSPPPADPMLVELTRRELDVLRLLAEGMTNAQIAKQLVLSTVTVNSYLRTIYSKLGVSTRTAATRYALDHHLI